MNNYLFFIFFIIIKAYANNYRLDYNPHFNSCDGIEKLVDENNPKYVSDVKISTKSSIIYKRVLFGYYDADNYFFYKDIQSIDYYALLLNIKVEQNLDNNGNLVKYSKIDWANSLLSRIYLFKNINNYLKSPKAVHICNKNYINEDTHLISDKLTLSNFFSTKYNLDSFIAIEKLDSSSSSAIEIASPETHDILDIDHHQQILELTKKIAYNRKILIKNDFMLEKLNFSDQSQNYIIQVFNNKDLKFNNNMLDKGISFNDLSHNFYIVNNMSDHRELYICGLKLEGKFPLFEDTQKFVCFIVELFSTADHINNLNEAIFISTNIETASNELGIYFSISNNSNMYKVKTIKNNLIKLVNPNMGINDTVILDQRLLYFLRLYFTNKLVNDTYITVHNDLSLIKPELITYKENYLYKSIGENMLQKSRDKVEDELFPL